MILHSSYGATELAPTGQHALVCISREEIVVVEKQDYYKKVYIYKNVFNHLP